MGILRRFGREQSGVILPAQLVLYTAVVILGAIVGISAVRDSVVQEFGDLAAALESLNQSYSFSVGTCVSQYTDFADVTTPVAAGSCTTVGYAPASLESAAGSSPAKVGFTKASSEN